MKRNTKVFSVLMMVSLLAGASAFAETTGTLTLTGTVPGILEITVAAEPAASLLDLSTDQSNLLVATVTSRSNKKAGYSIQLTSANNGALKSSDPANGDQLSYSLSFDGVPVTLSDSPASIFSESGKTTGTGTQKGVAISYTGSTSFLYEDSYSDTLTFTVVSP